MRLNRVLSKRDFLFTEHAFVENSFHSSTGIGVFLINQIGNIRRKTDAILDLSHKIK